MATAALWSSQHGTSCFISLPVCDGIVVIMLHYVAVCVLQEVDIEKELGIELGHDDDDEVEDDKQEGMCLRTAAD